MEDETIIAMAQAEVLEGLGYETVTAVSGSEAVDIVREDPSVDLILMDIDLGEGMDGTEAADIILRERNIPVVFLSSHTDPEVVKKTEKITSYGYVVKNSGNTVLDASIKMAFRLYEANTSLRSSREELEAANEELRQAVEELEETNEELLDTQKQIIERDRALLENEEIFRHVAENVTDIIYIWDLETDRIRWIGDIDAFYSYDKNAFPRTIDAFVESLHPDDRDRIIEMAREGMDTRKKWVDEFRVVRSDGEELCAWGTGVALYDSDGRPYKVVGSMLDITEQKRIQDALAESESRYRSIFDNSLSGIFYIDIDGNILEANRRILEILGPPSLDETKRINVFTFKPLIDVGFSDDVRQCINRMENIFKEKSYVSMWGKKSHIKYYLSPIIRNDRVAAVMANLEDHKQLQEVEERLNLAERVIRALVDVPTDLMAIINRDGTILDISESAGRLVNFPRQELIGKPITAFADEEATARRKRYLKTILETGEIIRYESESHGQWFDTVLHPVAVDGSVELVVVMSRNITEQKKAEQALRESENRFRDLTELIPEIIFEMNREGILTYSNLEAFSRMGYTPEDFDRGLPGILMIAPEDRERAAKNIGRLMTGEYFGPSEYKGIRRDGTTFPATIHSRPVMKEGKVTGVRGIMVDITEQKKAEEEIRKALEQEEALFRELQHRVKNSFSIISSLVNLEAGRTDSEKARGILGDIYNRIMSMNNLYAMLYESGSVQVVRLDRYMAGIVQSLERSYSDMKGEGRIKADMKPVTIDVKRAATLGLILTELVTNAFKHALPGNAGAEIHVSLHATGPYVVLEVSNDSSLFPADFDLEKDSGTGLELVRVLSSQLNGSLEFICGKRIVFRVSIPATVE